jgi:hypothetical protein
MIEPAEIKLGVDEAATYIKMNSFYTSINKLRWQNSENAIRRMLTLSFVF